MKTPGESSGTPQRPSVVKSPGANPANDDGTTQLLKWGGWTLATGLLCALLTKTVFGGIGPQGPHTNSGWMALIITMMCLPFGFMLFLLGALKWLRNRPKGRP
jgi:hypothetical protein